MSSFIPNTRLGEYEGYDEKYDRYIDDEFEVHDFTNQHLDLRQSLYELAVSCDRARAIQRRQDRSLVERVQDFDNEHPFLSGLAMGAVFGSIADWFSKK